ncbi:MAG: two-component system NarL family sensor kinase [Flavobacteriales bacterium]|jgi:two-component system NarL family sensor kinase
MSKRWMVFLILCNTFLSTKAQEPSFLLGYAMPQLENMLIQKQLPNTAILPDSLSDCDKHALKNDMQLLFGESIALLLEDQKQEEMCDRPFHLYLKQIKEVTLDTAAIQHVKNSLLNNPAINSSRKAVGLVKLSDQLIKMNQFPEALRLLHKSLSLADEDNNEIVKTIAYISLITLFDYQNDTKTEKKYIARYKASATLLNSQFLLAQYFRKQSDLEMSYIEPDFAAALKDDLKALEIYQFLGLTDWLINTYNSLAAIYEETNDYASSLSYYNKALQYYQSNYDSIGTSYLYNNIGILYQSQHKHTQALTHLQKATDILERIDSSNSNLYIFYFNLAETYEALGQHKKALYFFKKFDLLEYERMNIDQTIEIALLQEKYETKEREKEIKELNLAAELQQLNIDKTTAQRNWVIGLIVFGFLFVLSIMRSMKLSKQKAVLKLKQGIVAKNQKMTLLTLKNENETTKALSVGQDSERKRIAIYLHDHFGNSMGALKMHAENIIETTKLSTKKTEEISVLINLIEATNKELRELSHELTDTSNSSFKLSENIERMCNSFNVSDELSVVFKADGENLLSTHVSLEFYRICQEALTNALKYSKASNIVVNLSNNKMGVNLYVSDNGIGMDLSDTRTNSRNGFTNMSNRARSVHAEFKVTTAPNEGAIININLPFRKS